MNISIEILLLAGSVLLLFSILLSKTGYRFGVPTLLMFLLAGMIFGTDGVGIEFDDVHTAQDIGMIALCIILFSGGLDTKIKAIRPVLWPGLSLSTAGVLLTTLITGGFVYLVSGSVGSGAVFTPVTAMLLAATMSSTDSASVFNILRSQRIMLKHRLGPMLELESGSNDPMAYLLTIILIQCAGTADINGWHIALSFVLQFGVGVLGGWLLGRLAVWTVNKVNLRNPELYLIMVLCFIFAIFSSVTLLKGNGYLAIYIAGIVMGNSDTFRKREIGTFLNGVTWLVQVVMFVLLGLLVNPKEMLGIAPIGILAALFMILVARPASVWLSLLPFGRRISRKSKLFVSWVGLRGAAPILFATYPVVAGVEAGSEIFNIVFFVTLISLLVQGTTIAKAAQLLGLSDKDADEADHFGIELPDSIDSHLSEMFCTESMLASGHRLRDLALPEGQLVILVRRGDRYIVPNGRTVLAPGDILLLLSPDHQ